MTTVLCCLIVNYIESSTNSLTISPQDMRCAAPLGHSKSLQFENTRLLHANFQHLHRRAAFLLRDAASSSPNTLLPVAHTLDRHPTEPESGQFGQYPSTSSYFPCSKMRDIAALACHNVPTHHDGDIAIRPHHHHHRTPTKPRTVWQDGMLMLLDTLSCGGDWAFDSASYILGVRR